MVWLQSVIPFTGILVLFQRITAQLTSQQYHLITGSLTWHEARSFCRVKYTDLAAVNNMDDKNRLVNMLGGRVAHTWIGLHKGAADRWMWSDGSGRAHFTKWKEGEPNNVAGDEWCGEMSETEAWNDMSCGDKKCFVCYERREDGKERYVYYSQEKSWDDSQEHCRSKHNDLAYVKTGADNSEIANLIEAWIGSFLLPKNAWIGLFKDAWMWSDGRETSFRYWLKGWHYSGDCAAVAVPQQGRWVAANCNQKTTFVCQGGLKVKKVVIRMKVRSDVDLTNSTVTDELLKKLETGLRNQRVTDFSLRWRGDKRGLVFQRHVGH
ncbi:macrophage mannose receptor 1-like [Seriola aureovittata]|uniref:macrophage mannose receptor 1-like n=1 Tax=Seriola aureovittata TaxID=2871759 RepID=UPI0024BD9099|nr:macrophage mannose receptor 1-like [Seriola aureovittata]